MGNRAWARIIWHGETCRRTLRRILTNNPDVELSDDQVEKVIDEGEFTDDNANGAMFQDLEAELALHGISFTRNGDHPDCGPYIGAYRPGWSKVRDIPENDGETTVQVERVLDKMKEIKASEPPEHHLDRLAEYLDQYVITPAPADLYIDDAEDLVVDLGEDRTLFRLTAGKMLVRKYDSGRLLFCPILDEAPARIYFLQEGWMPVVPEDFDAGTLTPALAKIAAAFEEAAA